MLPFGNIVSLDYDLPNLRVIGPSLQLGAFFSDPGREIVNEKDKYKPCGENRSDQ